MMPIAKIKFNTAGYPTTKPRPNNIRPIVTAKTVKRIINLDIYCFKGDYSLLALAAKLAIWPINDRSPVAKTTPFPEPSLLRVEKNAIFLLYKGLSFVHYADLAKS